MRLLQEASLSQPKGLVPFLPFSLIPVPGLLLALPYPPLFKRSLCFCIVFEFRLSHQQLIAVTHTPPPLFCSRFPFFFFFWKTENIGCAFGTKKTVVGCRGFVPRVSVAHPFDWFMLGCLVLPSLYDESVFCTEALSFFFFFSLFGESACLSVFVHVVAACLLSSHHESDIQSCFLFSTSFCHLASHAS